MEGTLSVQPQANPVKGFQEYFLNLTVENNKRNPWFGGELLCTASQFSLLYVGFPNCLATKEAMCGLCGLNIICLPSTKTQKMFTSRTAGSVI